jgi:small GTP-binding protein
MSVTPHPVFDYSVKTVIVGETGVGKTSFALRAMFSKNMVPKAHAPTIGVEYMPALVTITAPEPLRIKFQLWDTAGQERFATITRAYYHGSHLVCLVYSCAEPATLTKLLTRWWPEVRAALPDLGTVVVLVIGNKSDQMYLVPGADAALRPTLSALLDTIQQDTGGRAATHIRVSALRDSTVMPVLEAVAWECVNLPAVKRTRRGPDGALVHVADAPGVLGSLRGLVADPLAKTKTCCRG